MSCHSQVKVGGMPKDACTLKVLVCGVTSWLWGILSVVPLCGTRSSWLWTHSVLCLFYYRDWTLAFPSHFKSSLYHEINNGNIVYSVLFLLFSPPGLTPSLNSFPEKGLQRTLWDKHIWVWNDGTVWENSLIETYFLVNLNHRWQFTNIMYNRLHAYQRSNAFIF